MRADALVSGDHASVARARHRARMGARHSRSAAASDRPRSFANAKHLQLPLLVPAGFAVSAAVPLPDVYAVGVNS